MDDDDRQLREAYEELRWRNEESERAIQQLERNLQANLNVWREILEAEGPAAIRGTTEQEMKHVVNR